MHYTTGGITIKIAFQGVQGTICRYQILHPVKKKAFTKFKIHV